MPVSTASTRRAAVSADSFGSTKPPGRAQRPAVRFLPPFDEQHLEFARADGQDGEVDGDGEGFEGVLVVALGSEASPCAQVTRPRFRTSRGR